MISDAGFTTWLDDSRRKPVWSMELRGMDANDQEQVLYTSDRDYLHPEFIFFAVMATPVITLSLSQGVVANNSEIGFSEVTLFDLKGELDEWRTVRHANVTLRLGDIGWAYALHRTIFNAVLSSWQSDGSSHQLTLANNQSHANKLIAFADITTTAGPVGVLLAGLMIDSAAFEPADIHQDSLTQLDATYPYTFEIDSFEGVMNVMTLANQLLTGLPVDYGVNILNQLEVQFLDKPQPESAIKVTLLEQPQIGDALYPLSQITLTNPGFGEVIWSDSQVQADYVANARQESIAVAINNANDAANLAEQRGQLFNTVIDPVRLAILPANVALGETIYFEYAGLGFQQGQVAVVTDIEYTDQHRMTIEVAVWR